MSWITKIRKKQIWLLPAAADYDDKFVDCSHSQIFPNFKMNLSAHLNYYCCMDKGEDNRAASVENPQARTDTHFS